MFCTSIFGGSNHTLSHPLISAYHYTQLQSTLSYMNRKAHWEQIYNDKSPLEVSWFQAEPNLSLQFIARAQLPKDAAIIDVGGGTSVLVDRLHALDYRRLAVLDISRKALECARQRLGEKADAIEWFEADITEFEAPHLFQLWHDRAVFHFLTAASDRENYVNVLKRTLSPGGHLILAAFAIGGPQKCSGLDIVQYDAEKLAAELGQTFQLVETAEENHLTPAKQEQKFAYFRFIKEGDEPAT